MLQTRQLAGALCRTVPLRHASAASSVVEVCGQRLPRDSMTNVTPAMLAKTRAQLLHTPNHPLRILKVRKGSKRLGRGGGEEVSLYV